MSERIVTVDIGGTHARFAIAEVEGGRVLSLGEATTLHTKDHASFQTAWQDFERQQGGVLPRAVAIAIAGPTRGEIIRFTNNPWIIRPALISEKLNVDRHVLVNDFEAVGHAVAQADESYFERLTGPDEPLHATGTITIIGPGTGLGVAHIWRGGGDYRCRRRSGHIDFAPLDSIEDAILARLRKRHRRVRSNGSYRTGIVDIYETLASLEGRAIPRLDDKRSGPTR